MLFAGSAMAAPGDPDCDPLFEVHKGNFDKPTRIDNEFLPLKARTQYVYEGQSSVTGQPTDHTVIFTVTDLTKKISGVKNRVLYDVDMSGDEVTEAELTFFAQDENGNVWNFGEYPEEYQNGAFSGAPNVWIHGIDGALAGIHMLDSPQVGTPEYLQGFSPDIDFEDCAQIFQRGVHASYLDEETDDALVIDETSPLSDFPDAIQRKWYAPGVGIVQIGALDDPENEVLVLTAVNRLDKHETKDIRDAALALDEHGREDGVSDVYVQTKKLKKG